MRARGISLDASVQLLAQARECRGRLDTSGRRPAGTWPVSKKEASAQVTLVATWHSRHAKLNVHAISYQ
jgi:hypothetical protein